jgi:hypothetical protein
LIWLKRAIKEWVKISFKEPQGEILHLQEMLDEVATKLEKLPVTPNPLMEEEECQKKLQGEIMKDEEIWRLKSRGGKNSSFFHKQYQVRKQNIIVDEI